MPNVIAETANMSREEWLKFRLDGIGGSDAAALAGANPYKSPIVTYMEKVGLYDPPEPGEAAYWGNVLEDVVAKEFEKRYNEEMHEHYKEKNTGYAAGIKIGARVQRRNAIFAHDKHDFMRANIDRLIFCPVKGKGLLEVKTANQFLNDEWAGEDIPNQYYIQKQHYLEVMNIDWGYMAVLIGGQKYKHYYIERDREVGKYLVDLEHNFWNNHVLAKIPPEIDGADSTTEMYKILYPQSYEAELPLELGSEAEGWVQLVEGWKNEKKEAENKQREFENKIKDVMKDNEVAFAGPHKITWKTAKNNQRRFTIKLGE
jgi:predicted phage-related endonuclease